MGGKLQQRNSPDFQNTITPNRASLKDKEDKLKNKTELDFELAPLPLTQIPLKKKTFQKTYSAGHKKDSKQRKEQHHIGKIQKSVSPVGHLK